MRESSISLHQMQDTDNFALRRTLVILVYEHCIFT